MDGVPSGAIQQVAPNLHGYYCFFASFVPTERTYDFVCFATSESEAESKLREEVRGRFGEIAGYFIVRNINNLIRRLNT